MKVTDRQNSIEHMDGGSKAQASKRKGSVSSKTLDASEKISSRDELGSAKVKLSDRAQDMKRIRDQVESSPDVDEAKISKFKSMLAKGEYKVDSRAVADKMVDEHAYNDFLANTED